MHRAERNVVQFGENESAEHSERDPVSPQPVRIAHILGALKPGGVEAWLMRVLRKIDRDRFRFVFIVAQRSGSAYEAEAEALGARIVECAPSQGGVRYVASLAHVLRAEGPLHVVHSHVHSFSALTLSVAKATGVPMRIAHAHTDRRQMEQGRPIIRRTYDIMTRLWLPVVMTHGMAVSSGASADLFPHTGLLGRPIEVLPCGIDLGEFAASPDRSGLRCAGSIPEDATVIGHVGNFVPPKNHEFLLRVGAQALRKHPDWYLALAGSGPSEPDARSLATALGIADRVRFLGARLDVPMVLSGLMDAFLFPSLWEGLPTAVIEAQAAGLPCVISDRVTDDVIAPGSSVVRLSLAASIEDWVVALERAVIRKRTRADMSGFSIERSVRLLENTYAGATADRSKDVEPRVISAGRTA